MEYWRAVEEVRSAEGHEAIGVGIVRRDEVHGAPGEAQLLVAGLRLTVDDALRLARMVTSAAELVDAPF